MGVLGEGKGREVEPQAPDEGMQTRGSGSRIDKALECLKEGKESLSPMSKLSRVNIIKTSTRPSSTHDLYLNGIGSSFIYIIKRYSFLE